jgi:hypothetical protein
MPQTRRSRSTGIRTGGGVGGIVERFPIISVDLICPMVAFLRERKMITEVPYICERPGGKRLALSGGNIRIRQS